MKKVFQFLQAMKFAMRIANATGIGIMHLGMHDRQTETTFRSMADAIIEIRRVEGGVKVTNYVRIAKMLGRYYREPAHLK